MERESRGVNIDLALWKRAEILAIDKGMGVTDFVEKIDRENVQKRT